MNAIRVSRKTVVEREKPRRRKHQDRMFTNLNLDILAMMRPVIRAAAGATAAPGVRAIVAASTLFLLLSRNFTKSVISIIGVQA
jgi:hypothetical protein